MLSGDGIVATANHAVTIRVFEGSKVTVAFIRSIRVILSDGRGVEAVPIVSGHPPHEWVVHDYALLKIREKNLPYLEAGGWDDVQVGDELTAVGYAFDPPTLVNISARVSGRNVIRNPVGIPGDVNAIIFQAPINRGLSGSPLISNRSGKVVGIVSTRLAGVPIGLLNFRDRLKINADENGVQDPQSETDKALVEVISVLDNSLVSGMGAAVAIDYVRDALVSLPSEAASVGAR